jgi:hypothetical protein
MTRRIHDGDVVRPASYEFPAQRWGADGFPEEHPDVDHGLQKWFVMMEEDHGRFLPQYSIAWGEETDSIRYSYEGVPYFCDN